MPDDRVSDIGEFELIERLRAAIPESVRTTGQVSTGIGDDAAIWMPTPGLASVITTDTLVEGVHFRLDWTGWISLGFKALAVNLSYIAAMGAIPRLATVSLGLRGTERVANLVALYQGIGRLAETHGVALVGGDIVHDPDHVTISVTAIGEVEPERVLRRSGALAGDLICVSGSIGASAAGFEILRDPVPYIGLATTGLLKAAHERPNPRVALGRLLGEIGATAAMDLSDGLLGDLPKILAASGVAATIDSRSLPVAPAVKALFPDLWIDLALRGGEDYELLFTIPPGLFPALAARVEEIGATVTAIGTIEERADDTSGITLIGPDGNSAPVAPGVSWDHFT
ncbi:MAG TPA: thiamine-phosphate kinase [Thermomicrobiales bacterium]|nr:thiamine-phosphate kinase [Thermomicrobiales bacterium]